MKKIIFTLFFVSFVLAQTESSNRSLTIYKDNFAVINEPIIWNVKSGKNVVSFSNILFSIFEYTIVDSSYFL